jgi:hypothetical protein
MSNNSYDPNKNPAKRGHRIHENGTVYELSPDAPLVIREEQVGLGFWGCVLVFLGGAWYGAANARIRSLEERLAEKSE